MVSGLRKIEPTILRSKEMEDLIKGSEHGTGNIDGRDPSNVDGIKTWDSANEHLFRVLRLTTKCAARSVLLHFEVNLLTWRWEKALASFIKKVHKQFSAAHANPFASPR